MIVSGYHRNDIENIVVENTIALMSEPLIMKLQKKIRCEICSSALIADHETHPTASDLLHLKDPKMLPSKDLIDICIISNNVFEALIKLGQMTKDRMIQNSINKVKSIIKSDGNENLFDCLNQEKHDAGHRIALIETIVTEFISVRRHKKFQLENSLNKNYRGKLHTHLSKYCQ